MAIWVLISVAILAGCIYSAGFRKAVAGLFAALIVISIGVYGWVSHGERQAARLAEEQRRLVPVSDVELRDLRMSTGDVFARLSGSIKNANSTYTITEVTLLIRIEDCPDACEIVGETTETIYVEVPPGQSRAVSELPYFPDLSPKTDSRRWSYSITSVRARP